MYWDITEVHPNGPRMLALQFADGLSGTLTIDLSFCTGAFTPLQDDKLIETALIDNGVLIWPNGLELAPDTLHREIKNNPDRHYVLQRPHPL